MIPILYEHGETSFTTNGVCRLPDCVSCKVTEVINGLYECVFEYPMTGKHYDQIIEDRIIYTTHDDGKIPQPFDIYKRTAPMNGVVTFYAKHISYRLNKVILEPYTASTATTAVSGITDHSINHNAFTFTTSITSTEKFQLVFPASVRNALGAEDNSILTTYGGEVEWNKFNVSITSRRGMDRDVQLRFGKNLEDIRYESDITETYNAIVPYWKSSDGKMLKMLPEKVIYLENVNNGTYDDLDDDEIIWSDGTDTNPDDLFTDSETGSTSTGNTSTGSTTISDVTSETKAVVLDLSSEFDDVPSDARLREVAIAKFNESLVPLTNIEVRFFELWNTTEYEKYASLQRVFLGDTVKVVYTDLGVNISKRVVKTVYDSLLERYESMELGTVQKSFGTTVAAKVKQEIMKITPTIDIMAEAIDHGTELLRGGLGGHVVIGVNGEGQPNEIFILDTDSIETAVHVLRININGIGFSSTGYNGTYDTAWTLDGTFYADFITAGTLSANRIKAGVLQPITGDSFINMLTGQFRFGNANDYIAFDKDSSNVWHLVVCANLKLGGNSSNKHGLLQVYNANDALTAEIGYNGIKTGTSSLFESFYTRFEEGNINGYYKSGTREYRLGTFGFINETIGTSTSRKIYTLLERATTYSIFGHDGNSSDTIAEFQKASIIFFKPTTFSSSATISGGLTATGLATFNGGVKSTTGTFTAGLTSNGGLSVSGQVGGFAAGVQITGGRLAVTSADSMEYDGLMRSFSITASYNIHTNANVFAQNISNNSDRKLKENIQKTETDIIDCLKVVSFDWKKGGVHVSAGFIAQDVQEICPELVDVNANGMLGLNYIGIVPHLVHKVQSQQKEIDNLKKEIAEIKSLLKGMR